MAELSSDIIIPVSPGELVDRLTILEIKSERMDDAAKLDNVRHELDVLSKAAKVAIPESEDLRGMYLELKAINEKLWVIEDDIRDCERRGDFGEGFVALARAVYRTNDERAAIKRRINEALGAALKEEKSYTPY